MFRLLLSWLGKGPLDRVLTSVDRAFDNGTEREKVRADAVTAFVQAEAERRREAMQCPVFWAVWALFAVPLGLWFGAVCLDSIFLFSGNISVLPDSIKPYADTIFAAVFGSGAGVAGVQAISRAIRGRG
ncbi:hypothetical protein [Roseibium sp. RKSG952]|uniref:hypothetical protein n=1 Tax=Roseibium sp. RKSG952 TaxID=2529384 RepID=UPI0012BC3F28|nr:hypothetical protein [Roseibium sp. RKSG952]MTH94744.1 hypothetical protein [Roseibium sp. RKSG952]